MKRKSLIYVCCLLLTMGKQIELLAQSSIGRLNGYRGYNYYTPTITDRTYDLPTVPFSDFQISDHPLEEGEYPADNDRISHGYQNRYLIVYAANSPAYYRCTFEAPIGEYIQSQNLEKEKKDLKLILTIADYCCRPVWAVEIPQSSWKEKSLESLTEVSGVLYEPGNLNTLFAQGMLGIPTNTYIDIYLVDGKNKPKLLLASSAMRLEISENEKDKDRIEFRETKQKAQEGLYTRDNYGNQVSIKPIPLDSRRMIGNAMMDARVEYEDKINKNGLYNLEGVQAGSILCNIEEGSVLSYGQKVPLVLTVIFTDGRKLKSQLEGTNRGIVWSEFEVTITGASFANGTIDTKIPVHELNKTNRKIKLVIKPIRFPSFTIERNLTVDFTGTQVVSIMAPSGQQGEEGTEGRRPGEMGGNGKNGTKGLNGPSIKVYADLIKDSVSGKDILFCRIESTPSPEDIRKYTALSEVTYLDPLKGTLKVISKGGSGGAGGKGGMGGPHDTCKGKFSTGDGGNGGNGSDGGNGGDVTLYLTKSAAPYKDRFILSSVHGKAGRAGGAGKAGSTASYNLNCSSPYAGSSGSMGSSGSEGFDGKVSVIIQ